MSERKAMPSGAERAAIFIRSLGEDEAAAVLKHLGPREVQVLGTTLSTLSNVTRDQVDVVLTDFVGTVEKQTSLGIGNSDYIRSVLVKALGEDRAGSVIDRIVMGAGSRGLEQLKWLDPKTIAEMVRLEHPQIIAIVLAYLGADQAAQVLLELPAGMHHDIIMRVATLEGIQPAALAELDDIMERQFSGKQRIKSSTIGGAQSAANMLNFLETSAESAIMGQIGEVDSDLGARIQDLMFVFDDLTEVEDRGMQLLLREINSDTLVLALKGADEQVREKFFRNLSKRAAEMLQDDLETKGAVRVSEVESAQKEILAVAKRMSDDGQINLGASGEAYVS